MATISKSKRIKSMMDSTMLESNILAIRLKGLLQNSNFTNGAYLMCLKRQSQLNRRFYKLYTLYKESL